MELNCAGFLQRSYANGPGVRAVLWVQGCPFRCPGCFNPELWPFVPNEIVTTDDLAENILRIKGIDGITFSGGEPFLQARGLGELGEILQQEGRTVVTFTGFSYDFLATSHRPAWQSLLAVTDLLIGGAYHRGLPGSQPLLSTANQRLVVLNNRWNGKWDSTGAWQDAEIQIEQDGTVMMTGFPSSFSRRGGA